MIIFAFAAETGTHKERFFITQNGIPESGSFSRRASRQASLQGIHPGIARYILGISCASDTEVTEGNGLNRGADANRRKLSDYGKP